MLNNNQVLSPGELFSCVSNDGGCSSLVDAPTPVNQKIYRQNDYIVDESSSSSFYSSFLYKSSDSSCNPDQKPIEYLSEVNNIIFVCYLKRFNYSKVVDMLNSF